MHETTQPCRYRIVIRGRLGDHLAGAFDDLEIEMTADGTRLTGTLADQAQLFGLLERLRDLGIAIVSVNPCTDSADTRHMERNMT